MGKPSVTLAQVFLRLPHDHMLYECDPSTAYDSRDPVKTTKEVSDDNDIDNGCTSKGYRLRTENV